MSPGWQPRFLSCAVYHPRPDRNFQSIALAIDQRDPERQVRQPKTQQVRHVLLGQDLPLFVYLALEMAPLGPVKCRLNGGVMLRRIAVRINSCRCGVRDFVTDCIDASLLRSLRRPSIPSGNGYFEIHKLG